MFQRMIFKVAVHAKQPQQRAGMLCSTARPLFSGRNLQVVEIWTSQNELKENGVLGKKKKSEGTQ